LNHSPNLKKIMISKSSLTFRAQALVFFAQVSALLFSGIVFGWPALSLILEGEQVYHDLCPIGSVGVCDAQQEALDWIFSVAAFVQSACGIVIGLLLDILGPLNTTLIGTGIGLIGTFLMAKKSLLVLAYCCYSFSGMCVLLSGIRTGSIVPLKYIPLVVGGISGMFDASIVVFRVFLERYNGGTPYEELFLVFGAVQLSSGVILACLWGVNGFELTFCLKKSGEHSTDAAEENGASVIVDESLPLLRFPEKKISEMEFSEQIKTPEFRFAVLFCMVEITRSNLFLGILGPFLDSLGDTDHSIRQTLTWIFPFGVVFVPFVAALINRLGLGRTAVFVNVVALTYLTFQMIPMKSLQFATGAIFTFSRCLCFSYLAAFCAQVFGFKTIGRVNGVMYTASSFLQFIQTPALIMTDKVFGHNFLPLNLMIAGLVIFLSIPLVIYLARTSKVAFTRRSEE
jgi:MFS family permease